MNGIPFWKSDVLVEYLFERLGAAAFRRTQGGEFPSRELFASYSRRGCWPLTSRRRLRRLPAPDDNAVSLGTVIARSVQGK
mgnify:CR=1 FL=1